MQEEPKDTIEGTLGKPVLIKRNRTIKKKPTIEPVVQIVDEAKPIVDEAKPIVDEAKPSMISSVINTIQSAFVPKPEEAVTEEKSISLSPEPEKPDPAPTPTPIKGSVPSSKPIASAAKPVILDDLIPTIPIGSNEYLRKKEKIESETKLVRDNHPYLYPDLDDPEFAIKIARRKEFADSKYDGQIMSIEEQANKLCGAEFELMPHQIFVKNFLSLQTPYNSLLLYHGLGSGKTCSSIGIAEEQRAYMKQVGIRQKIMVVASPNVQANFRLQLFDERRLTLVDGIWTIHSCIGDTLLKEVNPTNSKGITRERIISQIKSLINQYYLFMGYIELSNYIAKKTTVPENSGYSPEQEKRMEIQNIRRYFNNHLIIIDEVHNIRLTEENKDWKTGRALLRLAKYCDNLRLLMLSATPMYNSPKEIIWLINLMNLNDKRGSIAVQEVFDKNGNFRPEKRSADGQTVLQESGRDLLHRKMIGYVSYIRGENPYTFPYRMYPTDFAPEHTFREKPTLVGSLSKVASVFSGSPLQKQYQFPTFQLNGKTIDEPLDHLPVYVSTIGPYQEQAYRLIITEMRKESAKSMSMNIPSFDEMDRFGFQRLQIPLEALNIVYPGPKVDAFIMKGKVEALDLDLDISDKLQKEGEADEDAEQEEQEEDEGSETEDEDDVSEQPVKQRRSNPLTNMVGKRGLKTIMTFQTGSENKVPIRYGFEYKPEILAKYGRIFSPVILPNYSAKIARIMELIKKSTGVVMIYSQYIDGGIVPLALALEEIGLTRYGSTSNTRSLFNQPPVPPIDALHLKSKAEFTEEENAERPFIPAKYVMITGDKAFSPNNAADVKAVTGPENRYGEIVKVIMISKAGFEGLDFKNIRQLHIMEPWYNLNRIEQTIGRSVRNLSHCALPFQERNVEIYMHATALGRNEEEEAADVYVYRLAKKKAGQIGQVTRLLKETAVDCLLNIGQTNFTVDKLNALAANQNIELILSTEKKVLKYRIGDRPHTDVCDYMENCSFQCNPTASEPNVRDLIQETYSSNYAGMNNQRIMQRIRQLFRDPKKGQTFYRFAELVSLINIVKTYPLEQIYSALTVFIQNKNEYIVDQNGRRGNLVNRGDIYAFQPVEINDEEIGIYERSVPIDVKRSALSMEISKNFVVEKETKPEQEQEQDAEKPLEQEQEQEQEAEEVGILGKKAIKKPSKGTVKGTVKEVTGPIATAAGYEKIMDEFRQNLEIATTPTDISEMVGSKDWYQHTSLVINHLQLVYEMSMENIVNHIIHHMVDVLLPPEKLVLVSHMYSKVRDPESMDEIEQVVKEYLDTKMITVGKYTAFFLAEEKSWKLYKQSPENLQIWVEAEPEDIRTFEQSGKLAEQFGQNPAQYSSIIGFINMFRTGKEMVFRIKDVTQQQNNTGTRIDSQIKSDLIKRMNAIVGDTHKYDAANSKTIYQVGFCVLIEMVLRERTITKTQGQVWYLDPEQAMYNKITKYQRR